VGRASRRKMLRREAIKKSGNKSSPGALKRAGRAERFGRSVKSDLSDYEAVARRGRDSLAAALISRHNQRMERIGAIHPTLLRRARQILNQSFGLDLGLRQLGADPHRPPIEYGGGWTNQLAWAVDSIISAIRLLSSGQFVGAAQVGRSQFERWAINLAHNAQISRRQGEATSSFYNRLWSAIDADGVRIVPEAERSNSAQRYSITGRAIEPGLLYDQVSEFLHARGTGVEAAVLEACELLNRAHLDRSLDVGHQILDMLELCIERIRACITATLVEIGHPYERTAQFYQLSRMTDPAGSRSFPSWSLWPFNPVTGLSPHVVAWLRRSGDILARIHRGERPAGRLYRDDEISELYFLARRARSAEFALEAFKAEAEALGGSLYFNVLHGRDTQLVLVGEILALVGLWNASRPAIANSAAVSSSGLRSAYWLWLEDDDRAMGVLRIVVEAIARLRTWTRNPNKAEKLELRSGTAPRDWLDAAGWRRLQALNMALGELAHTRSNSRWGGARDLLVKLQPPNEKPEWAPHRGRGFALDTVAALCARTALEAAGELSAELQEHLVELMDAAGVFNQDVERKLEEWLARNWDNRSFDLGEGDFSGPATGSGAL